MGFSRQEYWSGVPLPSPESACDTGNKGLIPGSVDSLEKTLMLGGIGGQEEKGTTEDEMAGWHH